MKLATLMLVGATVVVPVTAFAQAQMGTTAPRAPGAADSSVPGATNPNTSNAPATSGATGMRPAGDSSVPGATNPNTSMAPPRTGGGMQPAGDSSVPGVTNPTPNR